MSPSLSKNDALSSYPQLPLITALLKNSHDIFTVAAQLCQVLDAAPLFLSYVSPDLRYRLVNRLYPEWYKCPLDTIIGRTVREVIGDPAFEKIQPYFEKAFAGKHVRYETAMPYRDNRNRFVHSEMIPDFDDAGNVRGVVLAVIDVTSHYNSERRERFISDLLGRTRMMSDPDDVLDETVRSVGTFLGLSRYMYADVDTGTGTLTVHRDFCGDETIHSVAGTWALAPWGAVLADFIVGRTVVNRDYKTDPRTSGDWEAIYEETDIRANVTVPLHRNGKWVGVFSAQMCGAPRDWTADEVALLEMVAHHMWITLENARLLRLEKQNVIRQRHFIRDLLLTLTEGKLTLCESSDDLPQPYSCIEPIDLSGSAVRLIRAQVQAELERLHFPKERIHDLLTATAEAAMNAVVHGGGGTAKVCTDDERGVVQVWVSDQGAGITDEALPRAFEKGASTAGTLGHGFYLIMNTCDRVWLLTGATGTTVVLEQDRLPPHPVWMG